MTFNPSLKHFAKLILRPEYRKMIEQKKQLASLPRYTEAIIRYQNRDLKIVDNASFEFIEKEVFQSQIYRFKTSNQNPLILDCGANIGLSVIYFKQLYPGARILAFEPDKKIVDVLEYNCRSFQLSDVEIIAKACWNQNTTLQFFSEGADGGRTAQDADRERNLINVEAIRLRDYINQKVELLKMDIEGAEFTVLADIADRLHLVERIFVEYHSFIGQEQHLPELLTILKSAGFRLHISAPGLSSANPFVQINTYAGMDGQLNIFATRN